MILVLVSVAAVPTYLFTRAVAAWNRRTDIRIAAEWYERGQKQLREGDTDAATDSLRRASVRDRDNPSIALALAQVLAAKNRDGEARSALLRLTGTSPNDPEVHLELARLSARGGNVPDALFHYHEALNGPSAGKGAEGQSRSIRKELVRFLLDHDERGRALSELLVLAADAPSDAASHLEVARLFLEAGDVTRARDQFVAASRLDEKSGAAIAGAGEASFLLGDYAAARRYLEPAVERDPGDSKAAGLLETTRLIQSANPLALRLPSGERLKRVLAGLDQAAKRLDRCLDLQSGLTAPQRSDLESLRAEVESMRGALAAPRPPPRSGSRAERCGARLPGRGGDQPVVRRAHRARPGSSPDRAHAHRGGIVNLDSRSIAEKLLLRENHVFLALTVLLGVFGGLSAVLFTLAIDWTRNTLFGAAPSTWRLLAVPTLVSLVTGYLLARFFNDARGSGVPQTEAAYHLHQGVIPGRVVFGKFLTGALCVGSGHSMGREGPSVQIGAGIASVLGRWLRLSPARVQSLVPIGAAAALAAAFNTPVAAVLFALEEIIGDMNAALIGSTVVASVTAVIVERSILGNEPLFRVPAYHLVHPAELIGYAVLGIVGGIVSVLFCKLLLRTRGLFKRMPGWTRTFQPAIGGLAIGVILVFVPQVMGVGYEHVDQALQGSLGLKTLVLLCGMKLVATVVSYASGNAGGIFAPSLFLGAMAGGAVGIVMHAWAPFPTGDPGAYALVGMGTLFAGIIRVPMTSVFMIFELTQDYQILVPLMVANLLSFLISRHFQPKPVYHALLEQDGVHLPGEASRLTIGDLARAGHHDGGSALHSRGEPDRGGLEDRGDRLLEQLPRGKPGEARGSRQAPRPRGERSFGTSGRPGHVPGRSGSGSRPSGPFPRARSRALSRRPGAAARAEPGGGPSGRGGDHPRSDPAVRPERARVRARSGDRNGRGPSGQEQERQRDDERRPERAEQETARDDTVREVARQDRLAGRVRGVRDDGQPAPRDRSRHDRVLQLRGEAGDERGEVGDRRVVVEGGEDRRADEERDARPGGPGPARATTAGASRGGRGPRGRSRRGAGAGGSAGSGAAPSPA